LVGLYKETGNKWLTIDFKAAAGLQQVRSPQAHIYEQGYTWEVNSGITCYYKTQTQPVLTSYNMVANIGIDLIAGSSKKYKVIFGIENFFSTASFAGHHLYTNDADYTNGTTTHAESQNELQFLKNVSLFCINAGIVYVIQ
jgi:hypothetical protein